jgi:cytochrome c553
MNKLPLLLSATVAVSTVAFHQSLQMAYAEEPQKPHESYVPGLGDFMTAYVQPHHIKIWLAGHAGNWTLAEYEAKELRETFEDITVYQPEWNNFPISQLANSNLMPPLAELDQAIRAKSPGDFEKAYHRVTAACDSCHQATSNGFIAIKTPKASDFPDQEFQPR